MEQGLAYMYYLISLSRKLAVSSFSASDSAIEGFTSDA